MKSILYATDFSQNSVPALHYARLLSEACGASLKLAHIFDISTTFMSTVSLAYAKLEEAALKDHWEQLEHFGLEHIGKEIYKEPFSLHVAVNNIASAGILDKAKEMEADLIVVGMKGNRKLGEIFIGSTASALIAKSEIPVLAVPDSAVAGDLKTIVYATAFEMADIYALQQLVPLARCFNARIKLIHVATKQEYAGEDQLQWFKEMLRQKVSYEPIEFEIRFADNIFEVLLDYVADVDPDLLVMLEREEGNLLSGFWHRDLVRRMKTAVEIPLLSYQKKGILESRPAEW